LVAVSKAEDVIFLAAMARRLIGSSAKSFGFSVLLCTLISLAVASNASAGVLGQQVAVSQNTSPRGAADASVAFDTRNERFLVVWAAQTGTGSAHDRARIYGRFISDTGHPLGNQFQISRKGPPLGLSESNSDPIVAYNSESGGFLVVWHGARGSGAGCQESGSPATRIFGQRLRSTGRKVGPRDFTISSPQQRCPRDPSLVYNSDANEYLVVWSNETTNPQVYGQRLDGEGEAVGTRSFHISNNTQSASETSLAYDPLARQYLVVWEGGSIVGQRLTVTGAKTGAQAFVIGGGGNEASTVNASVTFNPRFREFLVVWKSGEGDTGSTIRGQRITEFGRLSGVSQFQVSDPSLHAVGQPTVAYDPRANQYQVVFDANDPENVVAQRLGAAGARRNSFVIAGSPLNAEARSLAWNPDREEFLTAWEKGSRSVIAARRLAG
jgi:hypothetical protein